MTTRLMSGIVFAFFQGNFGWTGMPFAFQVIVRVLLVCIMAVIRGVVQMFVDDLIGGGHTDTWEADRSAAITIMQALLGPDAEEPSKRESTADNIERSITILGWDFCLSTWTVDVAKRNRMKALFVFWAFNIDEPIEMERWEAMCSMAQRYSCVYRELGVLMGDLYSARPIFTERRHKRRMTKRAREAILLWRVFFIRTEIQIRAGIPTGRSIESFRPRQPPVVVEFDGSPKGIGVRLFSVHEGLETLVEEWGAIAPFAAELHNDSQYQNAMEIAAATCGLIRAVERWGKNLSVLFRGDSVTALEWLSDDMSSFQSYRARGSAILLVILRQEYGVYVNPRNTHLPKEQNTRADALSRGFSLQRIGDVPMHTSTAGTTFMESLVRCNPLTQSSTSAEICLRWQDMKEWCFTKLGASL